MAYSITLAHSRGMINDAQRDEWFTLVSSVGLSMDHDDFTEDLIAIATEAIKYVPLFCFSNTIADQTQKDSRRKAAIRSRRWRVR